MTIFLWTPLLLAPALISANCYGQVQAADGRLVIERNKGAIVLEPYGSNIVRVTIGVDKAAALAKPGYGFIAKPSGEGWSHQQTADGFDVFQSSRLVVRISPATPPGTQCSCRATPSINSSLTSIWPPGETRTINIHNDVISIATPEGKPLLTMWNWTMYHHWALSGDDINEAHKKLDPGYKVLKPYLTRRWTSTTTVLASSNWAVSIFAIGKSNAGTTTRRWEGRASGCRSWFRAVAMDSSGTIRRRPPLNWGKSAQHLVVGSGRLHLVVRYCRRQDG